MESSKVDEKEGLIQKVRIDEDMDDDLFKANYSAGVLKRQSTLALKSSFHLVNIILMAMC